MKDLNLVTFPASKNYPLESEIEKELTKEAIQKFDQVEKKIEQVRRQLEILDITQERIKFYLDEIDNFLP
ncbi:MAG: hypothetical protein DRQ88_04130 [Epsilonproteobacteria bacterium]|nr:MAG: hypothetical protein DRQ89_00595 [Campylobacterota bacterium]RLA67088.1 MAG: hypothetical protein DRQ88_04130 [Campylobacterota bacterium]